MGYLIFWIIICFLIASQFGEMAVPVFFILFIGVPAILVAIAPSKEMKEIRSVDSQTDFVKPKFTSSPMQKSILDVFNKRESIFIEMEALHRDIYRLNRKNKIAKIFFLRTLIKRNKEEIDTKQSQLVTLSNELNNTFYQMDIQDNTSIIKAYKDVQDSYSRLCDSKKIWDKANRSPVDSSGRSTLEFIQCVETPMHFIDVNNIDFYIYPNAAIAFDKNESAIGAFKLNELQVCLLPYEQIVNGVYPSDSEVVRFTWRFPRQNGGPDLRYKNNYKITVVRYGEIHLSFCTHNLVFYVSNFKNGLAFVKAFDKFVALIKEQLPTLNETEIKTPDSAIEKYTEDHTKIEAHRLNTQENKDSKSIVQIKILAVKKLYQHCTSIEDIIHLYMKTTPTEEQTNIIKLKILRWYIVFEKKYVKNEAFSTRDLEQLIITQKENFVNNKDEKGDSSVIETKMSSDSNTEPVKHVNYTEEESLSEMKEDTKQERDDSTFNYFSILAYQLAKITEIKKREEYKNVEKLPDDNELATYEVDETAVKSSYQSIPIPKSQEHKKHPYAMFDKMRSIREEANGKQAYRDINISFSTNESRFKAQAQYMVNFDDDYENVVPFQCYYSTYENMSNEQLRTYFSWRSKVRKGTVTNISASYVFVYIYELINNVGVKDCFDAISKIIFLWKEYERYDKCLEKYLPRWIKDYFICEDFRISFQDFTKIHSLCQYYPEAFCDGTDQTKLLEQYNNIANYKILSSRFFSNDKREMLNNCLINVMENVYKYFEQNGYDLTQIIFGHAQRQNWWRPFSGAIYEYHKQPQNKRVEISENEVYYCNNGEWSCHIVQSDYIGVQISGYILKRMEAKVRLITGYKYKLSPNIKTVISSLSYCSNFSKHLNKVLSNPDFDATIDMTVQSYFNIDYPNINKINLKAEVAPNIKIEIDTKKLEQIRKESLQIQERLIVEDDVPEELENSHLPNVEESFLEKIMPANIDECNEWVILHQSLSQYQIEAIKVIYDENNVSNQLKDIARVSGDGLAEVLLEGINQIAIDCIGDNIIETANLPVYIYEDYREEIRRMIRGS
jgi:hypothetical protein